MVPYYPGRSLVNRNASVASWLSSSVPISLDAALELRRDRMTTVRQVVDGVTDSSLAGLGRHVSTALMQGLLELAAQKGLRFVDLTSRPSRAIANDLYQSLGFKLRETNCYRDNLEAGQRS
jgi:hypothetical protein